MPIPRPPIKTMTDFIVFCFVTVVVLILLLSIVATIIGVILYPERDYSNIVGSLTDITTTLIGALTGFIAGRASGKEKE